MKIAWMVNELDLYNPAHRVRRYNMSVQLNKMGHLSEIMSGYRKDFNSKGLVSLLEKRFDVVIWTDLGPLEEEVSRELKELKRFQVFDHCESLWNFDHEKEIMDNVDLITCCSTYLAGQTAAYGFKEKAVVVRDAIESYELVSPKVASSSRERLKAVFMGGAGHEKICEQYRKTIESAGYELVIITRNNPKAVRWDFHTWKDEMLKCDVALAIQDVDRWPAKSNIKATVAAGLGLPVIASNSAAYKEAIHNGQNGFIFEDQDQLKSYLELLKDPDIRYSMGIRAHRLASSYALDYIATELLDRINIFRNRKYDVK
jgi:hypothetical protein